MPGKLIGREVVISLILVIVVTSLVAVSQQCLYGMVAETLVELGSQLQKFGRRVRTSCRGIPISSIAYVGDVLLGLIVSTRLGDSVV